MPNQKIVTETALSALASDIKTALSGKANSNDVYPKSQTYNRTEIDNALDLKADKSELYNVYPTEQESGSLVHITDGADNIPVKSLVSEIVAVESGNGQPKSPTNPYSISGFDNGIITRCGVNLCDEVFETGDISFATGGNITGASWIRSKNYMPIVSGLTIYVKSTQNINIFFYDCNKAYLGNNSEGLKSNIKNTEITISSKARYFRIATNQTPYNHDISINYPSSDTQYHAYNGNTYTFTFGQNVYGGHFDNKGNLVVTRVCKRLTTAYNMSGAYQGSIIYNVSSEETSDADFTKPIMCNNLQYVGTSLSNFVYGTCINYLGASFNLWLKNGAFSDLAEATQWLADNPTYICYYLATPITLSITSQDIPTLLGENNIFSNCGDVEVNYHADIGLYIDKKISSLAQA